MWVRETCGTPPEQAPHPTAPPRSVAPARLSLAFSWTLSSLIALRTPQELNSRSVRSRLACLMHVRSFCLIAVSRTTGSDDRAYSCSAGSGCGYSELHGLCRYHG